MLVRFLLFLACMGAGGALAWFLASPTQILLDELVASLGGVFLGGALWFALDALRATRLLFWLRGGASADPLRFGGIWAELAERTRRLLRRHEQQTREARQRLQDFLAAFQASPNGVVLLDDAGQIEWCNEMAQVHFGLDPQRDLQQHFGNLVRDPAFASYYASKDYQSEVLMPGREHTLQRPLRLSVRLHTYGAGRLLLLSRDVTQIEQAEAMRRDFVANVSHEIRTPLTVLAGFIETLQQLPLDAVEHARYLELMSRQAHRMQTLVADLLTLSRLEGSPAPGLTQWVALGGIMQQLEQDALTLSATLHAQCSAAHHIRFEAAQALEIAGSSSELFSALSNLVSNALRYTPAQGTIEVTLALQGDGTARFCVQDTGPGIAPEHIARLTERFYRVDRSRSRDTGGTGLGLAIVKHVAQRHGAELRIESVPAQGSNFSLTFPPGRVRLLQ